MNQKIKNYSLLVIIVILVITIAVISIQNKKTNEEISNISNSYSEVNYSENKTKSKLSSEDQENVVKYLEENISEISPEKEVLGGTFYLTSVDFIDNNNVKIEYEDGHIALMANINFDYLEGDEIRINNFEIVDLD